MLKILPFNSLNFSDSSVSFSSKSESYKFFPSKQIFGIWAWAVGTGGLLMGLIMWSNVPPIIPKCYTKKFFDFQKIHFYILPVSYFRLMLNRQAISKVRIYVWNSFIQGNFLSSETIHSAHVFTLYTNTYTYIDEAKLATVFVYFEGVHKCVKTLGYISIKARLHTMLQN